MPKYRVYFTTVVSSSIEIEAEDRSEAIDKAGDEFAYPSLCAQCSGWGQSYNMDLGEWEPDMSDEGVEEVS